MSTHPSSLKFDEALALLGLEAPSNAKAIKSAFRAAVKAARPDRPGGDAERFRRIIEAHGVLQAQGYEAPSSGAASAGGDLEISIDEAFHGVARDSELKGLGRVGVRLPAGMRDGDVMMISGVDRHGHPIGRRIRIAAEDDRAIMGDDLWITVRVDPQLHEDGGRVQVETPYGRKSVWSPKGLPLDAMLRIRDCGLPARDGYPQGHAFLKLVPDPALAGGLARSLLDRFTAAWTPHDRPSYRAGDVR